MNELYKHNNDNNKKRKWNFSNRSSSKQQITFFPGILNLK